MKNEKEMVGNVCFTFSLILPTWHVYNASGFEQENPIFWSLNSAFKVSHILFRLISNACTYMSKVQPKCYQYSDVHSYINIWLFNVYTPLITNPFMIIAENVSFQNFEINWHKSQREFLSSL